MKDLAIADGDVEGQAGSRQRTRAFVAQKRPFGPDLDRGETGVRLKVLIGKMRLHGDEAEFADDQRPALVEGQPRLQAEKLDVAPVEDRVLGRRGVVHEDGPHFRQRARIFEEKRITYGRDDPGEFVIAAKPVMVVVGFEGIPLAEPGEAAAEILGLVPPRTSAGTRWLIDHTAVVGLGGRTGNRAGGRRRQVEGGRRRLGRLVVCAYGRRCVGSQGGR